MNVVKTNLLLLIYFILYLVCFAIYLATHNGPLTSIFRLMELSGNLDVCRCVLFFNSVSNTELRPGMWLCGLDFFFPP